MLIDISMAPRPHFQNCESDYASYSYKGNNVPKYTTQMMHNSSFNKMFFEKYSF